MRCKPEYGMSPAPPAGLVLLARIHGVGFFGTVYRMAAMRFMGTHLQKHSRGKLRYALLLPALGSL